MNHKLNKLLSVFLVLALFLTPIYAKIPDYVPDPASICLHGCVEDALDDDENNSNTIIEPPNHFIDGNGEIGQIDEIPIAPEDMDTTAPSMSITPTRFVTKGDPIIVEGSVGNETDVRVNYKVIGTTKQDTCTVIYSIEEVAKARFRCDIDISDLETKTYDLRITARDPSHNETQKEIELIVDSKPPIVTVNSISTRDRSPILTGTFDDLTYVKEKFKLTIDGKDYVPTVTNGTWEIQLERLSTGRFDVKISAEDEATNKTDRIEEGAITIRRGSGTRIVAETPAPTVQANAPAPAPVGPIVVTQPTPVVNTPTTPTTPTTGGTPTTTPTETTPITGNVTAVNPTGTSGATGFLGLPATSTGTMGIIIVALLLIGAVGYFFFFRK